MEYINERLYEEESKGARWPEKMSIMWLVHCHVSYYVHAVSSKRPPKYSPLLTKFN